MDELQELSHSLESEVSRLRTLETEIKRRQTERAVEFYSPHRRQAAFHEDKSRIRCILGGNRSGKTHSSQSEGYAYALGYRPWLPPEHPNYWVNTLEGDGKLRTPIKIMVAGKSYDHIRNVILAKLLGDPETGWPGIVRKADYDPKKGVRRNQSGIINWLRLNNGSTYTFMSYDQDKDKFESTDWDLVIFDEPPPESIWKATWRGMTDRLGRVIFAMTPLKEPWIFEKIIRTEVLDVGIHSFHTEDNIGYGLTKRGVDELAAGYDESELETRLEGKFLHLQGLIYADYMRVPSVYRKAREKVMYKCPRTGRPIVPKSWGLWMAIDPHPRVPHHAIWIAARPDGRLVLCGELQANDKENSARLFARRCLDYERSFLGFENPRDVYRLIDPSSRTNNPGEGGTVWQNFAEEGVVCRNGSKDLHGCIDATRTVLKYDQDNNIYPELLFCDDLPGVHREMCGYVWDEWLTKAGEQKTAKQSPKDKDDHFIECMHRIIKDGPQAPRQLEYDDYNKGRRDDGDMRAGY